MFQADTITLVRLFWDLIIIENSFSFKEKLGLEQI